MKIYKVDCAICHAWYYLKRAKHPVFFTCKSCKRKARLIRVVAAIEIAPQPLPRAATPEGKL